MAEKEWSDDGLSGPDPRVPQQHSSKGAEEAMSALNNPIMDKEEPEEVEEALESKEPMTSDEFAQGVEAEKRNNGIGPLKPMRD